MTKIIMTFVTGLLAAALIAPPAMAAEGSATGNGTSTLSGPAGNPSNGQPAGGTTSGRSSSSSATPTTSSYPTPSREETNGGASTGGPANR